MWFQTRNFVPSSFEFFDHAEGGPGLRPVRQALAPFLPVFRLTAGREQPRGLG
jgi:hypothetical protein